MNKNKVIISVSEKSGVCVEDCKKVLDAFEEVFKGEIAGSKWKNNIFNNIYKIMSYMKNKKNE